MKVSLSISKILNEGWRIFGPHHQYLKYGLALFLHLPLWFGRIFVQLLLLVIEGLFLFALFAHP